MAAAREGMQGTIRLRVVVMGRLRVVAIPMFAMSLYPKKPGHPNQAKLGPIVPNELMGPIGPSRLPLPRRSIPA